MLKETLVTQGATVGKYRIEARVAEGGMGVFWRALDTKLDRTVGLKTLHTEFAVDAQLRERFINEARTLAKLSHPNICVLHDFFESGEQLYIVMEYIQGETLADLVRQKSPLGRPQIVPIFRQILLALDYAHNHGVIHRDIKPSNIMVTEQGIVKVMDFGIAKIVEAPVQLTRTGRKMGSLFYMSPEQIREQQVDHRSDLYSLGVTLYQVCTGRLPFDATSEYEVMKAHLETIPPTPRSLNASITEDLEYVIVRALSKRPEDRFQNASDMRSALGAADLSATSDRVVTASGEKTRIDPGGDAAPPKSNKRSLMWVLVTSTLMAASLLAWPDSQRMRESATDVLPNPAAPPASAGASALRTSDMPSPSQPPAAAPESTAQAAAAAGPGAVVATDSVATAAPGDAATVPTASTEAAAPTPSDSLSAQVPATAPADSAASDASRTEAQATASETVTEDIPSGKPDVARENNAVAALSEPEAKEPQVPHRVAKPAVLRKYNVHVAMQPAGVFQLDSAGWGQRGGRLDEGTHRLDVMAPGYPIVSDKFQLKGDTTITVDLVARSAGLPQGELRVSARTATGDFPPCQVRINGADAGVLPGLWLPLKTGSYEIELIPPRHLRVDSLQFEGTRTSGAKARIKVPPTSRSFARFFLSAGR